MSLQQHVNDLHSAATPQRVEWLADKIAGYGDAGVGALLKLLTAPDPHVASRALEALELTHLSGDPRVASQLEHLLLTCFDTTLPPLLLPVLIRHAEAGRTSARAALDAYGSRGTAECEAIARAMQQVVRS